MMSFTPHCASSLHKAALNRVIICYFHSIRIKAVHKSGSVLVITWRGFPKVAGCYVTSATHTYHDALRVFPRLLTVVIKRPRQGNGCHRSPETVQKQILPATLPFGTLSTILPGAQPFAAMRSEASFLSRTPTFGLSVAPSQSSNLSVRHPVLQGHPGSFQLTCQYFCTGSTSYYGIIIFGM